jgi:sugar phosphate isomerase/epimerase
MPITELGIAASTFTRRSLAANLETVARYGLTVVHYDLACAGLSTLPDTIAPELPSRISAAAAERSIRIASVSGTFNMIDPVPERRRDGVRRLRHLAAACAALQTRTITLSTGTRDPDDIRRAHPLNASPEAWTDLLATLEQAVGIADEFDLQLTIEPNTATVVNSSAAALRLLREVRSPRLRIVLDPASLVQTKDLHRQQAVLDEATDILGPHIVMATATDVLLEDGALRRVAAGTGHLDYPHYLACVRTLPVPLIVCGLSEFQVPAALWFLRTTSQAIRRIADAFPIGA